MRLMNFISVWTHCRRCFSVDSYMYILLYGNIILIDDFVVWKRGVGKNWLERLLKNEAAVSVCSEMHMLYEDICVFHTNDEERNEQFLFLSFLQWYVTNWLTVYCEGMPSYTFRCRLRVDTFLINYAVAISLFSCRISQKLSFGWYLKRND